MRAAVDVGTNTIRLLVGEVQDGRVVPERYYRQITRLGGGITEQGLSPEAMARTLAALTEFARELTENGIFQVKAVGTEVLRRAGNAQAFVRQIAAETGFLVEIVDGETEARLTAAGVLSTISPQPTTCLIVDIGGGSTEFTLWHAGQSLLHCSYSLGVVRLAEEGRDAASWLERISPILEAFRSQLEQRQLLELAVSTDCQLIGTAGTVTTLAALQLGMTHYDWRRINNLVLDRESLQVLLDRLEGLTIAEREALPGMEKGRGDLIVPGLHIVISLMTMFFRQQLTVSDFGLLEGILLDLFNEGPF